MDCITSQSDCRIHYHTFWEKNKFWSFWLLICFFQLQVFLYKLSNQQLFDQQLFQFNVPQLISSKISFQFI